MRIIKAQFVVESTLDGTEILARIERAARTCYKSEDRITTPEATQKFVARILGAEHDSVIEHESATVRIICDRGISHEIVRHRLASYSQESSRYVCYAKEKFGSEITVIDIQPFMNPVQYAAWTAAMFDAEAHYMTLIRLGTKPEIARSVLPMSTKTELVVTMNMRAWRHFFRLRTAKTAHPQIRELAEPLLAEFRSRIPVLFDGIGE